MQGLNLRDAASCFCAGSEHCSDCPAHSNAQDCLILAIAQSPMDPVRVIQFLANHAQCHSVVATADGNVT